MDVFAGIFTVAPAGNGASVSPDAAITEGVPAGGVGNGTGESTGPVASVGAFEQLLAAASALQADGVSDIDVAAEIRLSSADSVVAAEAFSLHEFPVFNSFLAVANVTNLAESTGTKADGDADIIGSALESLRELLRDVEALTDDGESNLPLDVHGAGLTSFESESSDGEFAFVEDLGTEIAFIADGSELQIGAMSSHSGDAIADGLSSVLEIVQEATSELAPRDLESEAKSLDTLQAAAAFVSPPSLFEFNGSSAQSVSIENGFPPADNAVDVSSFSLSSDRAFTVGVPGVDVITSESSQEVLTFDTPSAVPGTASVSVGAEPVPEIPRSENTGPGNSAVGVVADNQPVTVAAAVSAVQPLVTPGTETRPPSVIEPVAPLSNTSETSQLVSSDTAANAAFESTTGSIATATAAQVVGTEAASNTNSTPVVAANSISAAVDNEDATSGDSDSSVAAIDSSEQVESIDGSDRTSFRDTIFNVVHALRSINQSSQADTGAVGSIEAATDAPVVDGEGSPLNSISGGGEKSNVAGEMTARPAPPLTTQVLTALVQNLSTVINETPNSLTLRLDPPELGEVDVEFTRSDEGVAVRVTARESVTMEMLLSRGGEIERMLRNQDADMVKVEFSSPDSDGRDDSSGTQFGAGQSGNPNQQNQDASIFDLNGQNTIGDNEARDTSGQPRRRDDRSRVRIRA